MIDAVVFDLDGLLLDSEHLWDEVREELARERGGRWHDGAQRDMMGMSSPEWSRYMHDAIGLAEPPEEINRLVVERMLARYARASSRCSPGAVEAVRAAGGALAARARVVVEPAADRPRARAAGLAPFFRATVSSEEVARGKPAPDVYLEAARRLGVEPARAVAVEDSHNGIRAAKAAGMGVVAIPNHRFPPGEDALAEADVVLESLASSRRGRRARRPRRS